MEYLSRDELVRLSKVARSHNPLHHVALLVGLLHGLRVSETLAIRSRHLRRQAVSQAAEEEPPDAAHSAN